MTKTNLSSLSLSIVSLCKMGWRFEDSCFWAAEMDIAIPANKLPELGARLEQIPNLDDRRLAFLEALGVKVKKVEESSCQTPPVRV